MSLITQRRDEVASALGEYAVTLSEILAGADASGEHLDVVFPLGD